MNIRARWLDLRPIPHILPPVIDLASKRVLIFVVAYNAEKTIESVLDRIPAELRTTSVEVLIIDDSSPDSTFHTGLKREDTTSDFKITILRNPENQGWRRQPKSATATPSTTAFDIVALVHGDAVCAGETPRPHRAADHGRS